MPVIYNVSLNLFSMQVTLETCGSKNMIMCYAHLAQ